MRLHIELNAIDLALDMAIRYASKMPRFVHDWLSVAADEGRHFMLLSDRLKELDSYYGALDAHDGLWEAAEDKKMIYWHVWPAAWQKRRVWI